MRGVGGRGEGGKGEGGGGGVGEGGEGEHLTSSYLYICTYALPSLWKISIGRQPFRKEPVSRDLFFKF